MHFEYVKITNDKVPLNPLTKTFTYEEIVNEEAVAILVPEGYVVLDLDNQDHFRCLCNIVKDLNLKVNKGELFCLVVDIFGLRRLIKYLTE